MKREIFTAFAAYAVACAAIATEYNWTGADVDNPTDWATIANWNNANALDENGNGKGDAMFLADAAGKTVSFAGQYGNHYQIKFRNGLESPVVFTAANSDCGLYLAGDSKYQILSVGNKGEGALTIQGGNFYFKDNVRIGDYENNEATEGVKGVLTLDGGYVDAPEISLGHSAGAEGVLRLVDGALTGPVKVGNANGATGELIVADDFSLADLVQVGAADGSTGTLEINTDATLDLSSGLDVGRGAGAEASVVVEGVLNVLSGGGTKNLCIARGNDGYGGANTIATVAVEDGGVLNVANDVLTGRDAGGVASLAIAAGGRASIGASLNLAYGGGTTGIVEVAGSLVVSNTLYLANGYAGTLARFRATAGETIVAGNNGIRFCERSGNVSSEEVLLDGGVLALRAFTVYGTACSGNKYSIAFDGGTLRALAANNAFIPDDERISVSVGANGGRIESDHAIAVLRPFTGSGVLVKSGSGILTFGVNPSCPVRIEGGSVAFAEGEFSGALVVGSGAFYRYDPEVVYSGGITLEQGAVLYVPAGVETIAGITGATSENIVVATGNPTLVGSVSVDGTTVTISTVYGIATETTWIGPDGGDWNTAANWTYGVPSETLGAAFVAGADVAFTSDVKAKSLRLNGNIVAIGPNDKTRKLSVDEFVSGDHGILCYRRLNLDGIVNADLAIPAGITNRILNCGTALSEFVSTSGIATTVAGPVEMEDGALLRISRSTKLLGGVSGGGEIDTYHTHAVFGGDWSRFTGVYYSCRMLDRRDSPADTGYAVTVLGDFDAMNGTFVLSGDLKIGTDASDVAATVRLGSLAMEPSDARKVVLFKDTTLEVRGGSIGENVAIDGGYSLTLSKTDGAGETLALSGLDGASVNVGEGTLSIGEAAPAIASLVFSEGAKFMPDFTLIPLAVAGSAVVDGVVVVVDDVETLAGAKAFDIISAESMTGTPGRYVLDANGETISTGVGNALWSAKRTDANALRIYAPSTNTGFVIRIR